MILGIKALNHVSVSTDIYASFSFPINIRRCFKQILIITVLLLLLIICLKWHNIDNIRYISTYLIFYWKIEAWQFNKIYINFSTYFHTTDSFIKVRFFRCFVIIHQYIKKAKFWLNLNIASLQAKHLKWSNQIIVFNNKTIQQSQIQGYFMDRNELTINSIIVATSNLILLNFRQMRNYGILLVIALSSQRACGDVTLVSKVKPLAAISTTWFCFKI